MRPERAASPFAPVIAAVNAYTDAGVQEAFDDILRFWLDRGVDGFRVDVVWHMIKDAEFRDNPPNPRDPTTIIRAPSADFSRTVAGLPCAALTVVGTSANSLRRSKVSSLSLTVSRTWISSTLATP